MNENFNSLPREERPYERCMLHGAGRLSDRELLAVLLRTGSKGRTVLELAGDLLHLVPERQGFTGLRRMTIEELSSVKGIGSVKAVQLKCVLELARRMAREEAGAGIYFKTPASVAEYYMVCVCVCVYEREGGGSRREKGRGKEAGEGRKEKNICLKGRSMRL